MIDIKSNSGILQAMAKEKFGFFLDINGANGHLAGLSICGGNQDQGGGFDFGKFFNP